MNFFVDNCVSWRVSAMLAAIADGEHNVTHITQDSRFTHATKDLDWLPKLAEDNLEWKIISGDADIIDTAHERAALIESNLTFFCLNHNWMKLKAHEQFWKMAKMWPEIVRQARAPTPTLFVINMGRSVWIEEIGHGKRARGGEFRG